MFCQAFVMLPKCCITQMCLRNIVLKKYCASQIIVSVFKFKLILCKYPLIIRCSARLYVRQMLHQPDVVLFICSDSQILMLYETKVVFVSARHCIGQMLFKTHDMSAKCPQPKKIGSQCKGH